MCDRCRTEPQILRMLRVPDDADDPIALAKRRLRCYYECVTADMLDEDWEDDDDDTWEPEDDA